MMLRITNLTKLYKNGRGLSELNLFVEKGQTYGFLGPNGSGKTTTLKLIVGLLTRDSGAIEFMGREISEHFEQSMAKIGCMFETAMLYNGLSAYENILFVARYFPEIQRSRINELLDMVGLAGVQKEKVARFSLGMRQRLALAQAMYNHPQLMILDEPLNGLDIQGIIEVRGIIKNLAREGATFIISSHIAGEVEKTCTNVGILYSGKLICEDTVEEILKHHPSIEDYYISKTKENCNAAV